MPRINTVVGLVSLKRLLIVSVASYSASSGLAIEGELQMMTDDKF